MYDDVEPFELGGPWQCVLEALRNNTPGRAMIKIDSGDDGSYLHKIVIIGDGTAVYTDPAPNNEEEKTSRHVQLYEASYYQGCLDATDTNETAACLISWFADDLCTPVTCCPESVKDGAPPACE